MNTWDNCSSKAILIAILPSSCKECSLGSTFRPQTNVTVHATLVTWQLQLIKTKQNNLHVSTPRPRWNLFSHLNLQYWIKRMKCFQTLTIQRWYMRKGNVPTHWRGFADTTHKCNRALCLGQNESWNGRATRCEMWQDHELGERAKHREKLHRNFTLSIEAAALVSTLTSWSQLKSDQDG